MRRAILAVAATLSAFAASAHAQEITNPMPVNQPMRFGTPTTVSVAFGLVALGSKTVTVTVPGVRAGDTIIAGIAPGSSLAAGVVLGLPDAPADNQVRLTLLAALALGVTVGNVNIRLTWFGPQ